MGTKAFKIAEESKQVRELFYNDGYYCRDVETHTYNQYISDNADNIKVLDRELVSSGIKLIISPTGSGKSRAILDSARKLVAKDSEYKIFIALPTRTLTMQVGSQSGVSRMVGGDVFDKNSPITASTYDKMFEVENYIELQTHLGKKTKSILILDECHLLTTQHLFRKDAIKRLIRCIEKNFFESVVLVTATPFPMTLFRCSKIIEFTSPNNRPSMDMVEMIEADDVMEYIKSIDYSAEFPFIRLESHGRIEQLINEMPQSMERVTKKDKEKDCYKDITENSKISGLGMNGILCTSVIEAGVNITDYPKNIVPTAVFFDSNISADDIEQFLNRIRRNGKRHVKCARVILTKPKEREIEAFLVTQDGKEVCRFEDIETQMGDMTISDTSLMDTVADGSYALRVNMGSHSLYNKFYVSSAGNTTPRRYSKADKKPIILKGAVFRPFMEILKANSKWVERQKEEQQTYLEMLGNKRAERQRNEQLSDTQMGHLQVADEGLTERQIKSNIKEMGDIGECLSYENGEILVDKRILYMESYKQYQRQYYHNHDLLKKELEERLNVRVVLKEQDTEKGKNACTYNADNIWEGIEDLRGKIKFNKDFYDAVLGNWDGNLYMWLWKPKKDIIEISKQEHLVKIIKSLEKSGVTKEYALKILTSSKTKRKSTQLANVYHVITFNQILNQLDCTDIKDLPKYKSREEKIQSSIYCYLKQKGQNNYTVSDMLAGEIIDYYKESYPKDTKIPTAGVVKRKIKQMYKVKDKKKNMVKAELRLKEEEIFDIVKPDFK